MNILFVTELEPFPPDRGERIRSYNLIKSMLKFSSRLIMVAGNAPPVEQKYSHLRYLKFPGAYVRNRWVNLLLLFIRRKGMTTLLKEVVASESVDLVFIDYNFLGQYIRFFKKRGIKVIYGTHNVQSELNYQRPVRGLKERFYQRMRFCLERQHENRYFKSADILLGVSEADLDYYRRTMKPTRSFLVPNYIDEEEYMGYGSAKKKNQVIMTGNFNAFQNHAGLRWFLEDIWDEDLAELAELVIAGHGSKEHFLQVQQGKAFPGSVKALGSVEDLRGLIAESKAAIIPLKHGSGTRLKCIEAMALKTNIISTTLGVEGIRHNGSIYIADDADEFKKGLILILKGEVNHADEAFRVFMDEYSLRSNTPRLKSILQT